MGQPIEKETMNQDQIDSLIRTLLKYGGGFLSAHGAVGLASAINNNASSIAQIAAGVIVAAIAQYGSHTSNATPTVIPAVTTVIPAPAVEPVNTTTTTIKQNIV